MANAASIEIITADPGAVVRAKLAMVLGLTFTDLPDGAVFATTPGAGVYLESDPVGANASFSIDVTSPRADDIARGYFDRLAAATPWGLDLYDTGADLANSREPLARTA